MIGDEYFDLRSRLGSQLHELAGEIRDVSGDTESIAILENLVASLKEPFVFVVVGEVNVGKSTFLNALFGQDFSRTGVVPTTDKILFFKHGPKHQIVPVTPTLDEVHVPTEFLKDFHIVDTPGTNSIENEHQQITERFVPIADLVIFVFSAMNPWGASAWQFLDRVHRHWMRNVIFVLQQADLRSPEEIQVINDYIIQLSRQRFGRDFPVFSVSAKKAYLARSSGVDRDRLMKESGFDQLENHISGLVGRNAARINKLANTVALARQLLEHVRERLVGTMRLTQRKTSLLVELKTEREMQVDRTLKKILPALDATERDYYEACLRIAGLVDETLATKRAFRKLKEGEAEVPQSLDHRLFQELQQRTGDRWRQVGVIIEEDYMQYERFLLAQGKEILLLSATEDESEKDNDVRRLFSTHIDSTVRRFVLSLKLDEAIGPGLAKARARARWVPWLIIPLILLSGIAWWLDGAIAAGVALVGGLMLEGLALLITQSVLNRTRREVVEKLEESATTLREMLVSQVRNDVETLFARFLTVLAPAQEEANKREALLNSRVDRFRGFAETLEAMGHEIQAAAPHS